ncbi:hypothetical protein ACFL2Q_13275 [Thermodesulfobacteriota bacterium]
MTIPEIMSSLGQGIKAFKKSLEDEDTPLREPTSGNSAVGSKSYATQDGVMLLEMRPEPPGFSSSLFATILLCAQSTWAKTTRVVPGLTRRSGRKP